MHNVSRMRPFKFPSRKLVDSEFIPSRAEENKAFMEEDLAASGLTPEDIGAFVHGKLALPQYFTAGYVIGYTSPDGEWLTDEKQEIVMWRTKLKPMDGFPAKRKYDQPSAPELQQHHLSGSIPYIPPSYHANQKTRQLAICEGEKKAACVGKYLDISAIGIGGCWNWRDGTNEGGVHPWILEIVGQHEDVIIIPDGDFRRYDISKAYGTFCSELRAALGEGWQGSLTIMDCPGKVDDLIVEWGDEAPEHFWALDRLSPNELVEDPSSLAKQYDLAHSQLAKGGIKVYENSSNVQRLLENHPSFERIWRNLDTSEVMMGEEAVIPDHTEMEIANHFQHNLAMPTVKAIDVFRVMLSLSKKNARSPFLTWVEDQLWDGVPRLDTYLIRHMGADDTPYVREVSSKFVIASVARQRKPGCKMDWMMITTGPQGIGKSSLARLLWRDSVTTIIGDHGNRDMMMKMHTSLCIVIDELDALNNRESEFWKSMIATPSDIYRAPYGRTDIRMDRRSVLYGTTNSSIFLHEDATGMRRYKPVAVTREMDQLEFTAEVAQLWAEAAHREKMGERYWEVLTASPEEEAGNFSSPDDEMEIITEILGQTASAKSEKFTFYPQGEESFRFTARELKMLVGTEVSEGYFTKGKKSMRLQNHLRALGFERGSGTDPVSRKGKPWKIGGAELEALKR